MPVLNITGEIANTTDRITTGKTRVAVTTTGDLEQSGVKDVGTSEESITLDTDFTANGYAIFWNTDATNYVQWGTATAVYNGRLPPGSVPTVLFIDDSVTTIFLKADTAACEVRYLFHEA